MYIWNVTKMVAKTDPNNTRDIRHLANALEPIAKLCLQNGKGVGDIILAVKLACIEVASRNAKLGNRLNHSQISAITGLTRKDVKVITNIASSDTKYPARRINRPRIQRVLVGWKSDPEFQDRNGNPATLTIKTLNSSFSALVRKYGGDVTPMSVFKELKRARAVSKKGDNEVRLVRARIRTRGFSNDALADVSVQLSRLGNTLVGNIEAREHPIFAEYRGINDLSPDEAALFQLTFAERAASLLGSVPTWTKSQKRLRKDAGRMKRLDPSESGVGVYLVNYPGSQSQSR
jgi:hypothetical protein